MSIMMSKGICKAWQKVWIILLVFMFVGCNCQLTTSLVDNKGRINRHIPKLSSSSGIVGIITSPGTPSTILNDEPSDILCVIDNNNNEKALCLACRGATLSAISDGERLSLATTSLMANAILIDGITEGDVEMGFRHSRHARTLTALFRARQILLNNEEEEEEEEESISKQTLLLGILGTVTPDIEEELMDQLQSIFDATSVEKGNEKSLEDLYSVVILSVQSDADGEAAKLQAVQEAAAAAASTTVDDFASHFNSWQERCSDGDLIAQASDPPLVAQAFLSCRMAYAKHAKSARAKVASWKVRLARGLTVDGLGQSANHLLERMLNLYNGETLVACGMDGNVLEYRQSMRRELTNLLQRLLTDVFQQQVSNLERIYLQRMEQQLLILEKTKIDSVESTLELQSNAMRGISFAFTQAVQEAEIPSLGLVKEPCVERMNDLLARALESFPDSSAARIQRLKAIKKTASREKRKPSSGPIELGLDLVAMIRPDGFGSLQGFMGYQLAGNSITVGIANDADDPQVIAQLGGVRPPLLRVQPKLRVDVEL